MPNNPFTPEKLSLWDRLFNRYRREVCARGEEKWGTTPTYGGLPVGETREFIRNWVEYNVIDRVTGSVTIEREYLN